LIPGLEVEELPPAGAPNMGKGEFVEASMAAVTEQGPWTASATITKSDTDTFLFLTFAWPQNLDLTGAEYLVFDLEVPDGQEGGQRLLGILRDERGVEYLYDTQVALDGSRKARAYLPVRGFVRAGWAPRPEGSIDFSKIREIRMGWGGYKGHEGDKVVFGTSAPRVCGGAGAQLGMTK